MKAIKNRVEQVETLLENATEAERRNTEEALKIANEALNISKKHGLDEQVARSQMRIGRCHWISGDFDAAITYLNHALEGAMKLEDHETKAEALIGLGNVYITMELTDQAIQNYHTALSLVREKGLADQETKILNNLGTLHEDLHNYHTALEYYRDTYKKAQEISSEYGMAIAHLNMGNVYLELGELTQALKNIKRAYQHGKANNQTLLLAHSYYSFGQYYQKTEAYHESIRHLKHGIKNAEESKDFYILVRIYIELANAFDKIADVKAAQAHFEKAYTFAKRMNSAEFMPRVHEQLALFYERNKMRDDAYKHYKAYFDSSKIVQENRRKERIKNIEFQTKLKDAIQETRTYRSLSDELQKNFNQLQVLSKIGRSMTATHDIKTIFEQLYDNINELMRADTLMVGFHDEVKRTLDFDLFIEKNAQQETFSLSLDNKKSLSVYSLRNRKTLKFDDVEKEHKTFVEAVATSRGSMMLSAMYAPLIVEGETIGVLSIQARKRNTYTAMHKVLLETLASYLAIAIKNARRSKELAQLNKQLKALSELDGLTGIPNRRMFDETYGPLLSETQARNKPFSLLFIDIDDLKEFNDSYGHLHGDEVIIEVAHYLQENKEESFFVARYGGDEFVMLLPGVDLDAAKAYAQKLTDSLMEIKERKGFEDMVTVSIGLGTVEPDDTVSPEDLLAFVDERLYESKDRGKNRITAKRYEKTNTATA